VLHGKKTTLMRALVQVDVSFKCGVMVQLQVPVANSDTRKDAAKMQLQIQKNMLLRRLGVVQMKNTYGCGRLDEVDISFKFRKMVQFQVQRRLKMDAF
jgi:hypothetical protein